jgi:hypothetical protein
VNDNDRENLELRRMLEEAMPIDGPSADRDPASSLDPETAELRETWQQFAKLLEAGAPSDRPLSIQPAGCDASTIAEPAELRAKVESRADRKKAPRRFRWSAVALAASLLVAVGLAITLRVIDVLRDHGAAGPANRAAIAHDEKRAPSNQLAHDSSTKPNRSSDQKSNVASNDTATDRLQWNDSVDEDITAVAQATALAKQDWYAQSVGIGAVETGVSDLSRDLDQGPL